MKSNVKTKDPARTHEGGQSVTLDAVKQLRRTVMANMLFEDNFYEDGQSSAARIRELVKKVKFEDAAQIAIDAREKMKLRHVPLLIVRELIRNHSGRKVGDLIARVIQRPDELGELMALYRSENKASPLASQLKQGLARALKKFTEHQLAKYNRDGEFKLRDVLFLSHAKPNDEAQAALFKRLAENTLETPDTWEVALSEGGKVTNMDQKAYKALTFTRLLDENKLGALALLRNLRGMIEAGVDEDKIRQALLVMKVERVLPFRFITAARYAPRLEDALEQAMFKCLTELPKLPGKTALLIDHSGSMDAAVSAKSEVKRFDAATGLAMILRECAERVRVFTFSERTVEVAPRRGFALAQAALNSMSWGGTYLKQAVQHVYKEFPECERLIIITDEQSADRPAHPQGLGYVINVGTYKNGIAYGPWTAIDGWSEAILDFIRENEELGS